MMESTFVGLYNMRTTRAPMSIEDILLPVRQSNSTKQNFDQIRRKITKIQQKKNYLKRMTKMEVQFWQCKCYRSIL